MSLDLNQWNRKRPKLAIAERSRCDAMRGGRSQGLFMMMPRLPSPAVPWPVSKRHGDSTPRRLYGLFQGTCSLVFEGESFIERKAGDRRYWVMLNDKVRARVIDLLLPLGWKSEYESFEAEFWGELYWTGSGCGHFGVFGGTARVDEIMSVHFAPAVNRYKPATPRGIRVRIRS